MAQPRSSSKARNPSPNRSNRIDTVVESRIPNARAGGVRAAPGEARIQDATVTPWNDLATNESKPMDNNDVADERPSMADGDKQTKIRALLRRSIGGGPRGVTQNAEGETVEDATDEETDPVDDADDKVGENHAPAPTRRELMAQVDGERGRLALERELSAQRKRADDAEGILKAGDLGAIAKKLGLTPDQAMDAILTPQEEAAASGGAAPTVDERLSRIEDRDREVTRREARAVVDDVTKDMKLPVTRAMKAVSVTDDKGRVQVMSGRDLVVETARRLWEAAGKPPGDRTKFLREAAPAVEAQLIEDQRDAFEAYAAEHRGAAAPTPAATSDKAGGKAKTGGKAPPAISGRGGAGGGGGTQPTQVKLSDDPDIRAGQIKARFNWK